MKVAVVAGFLAEGDVEVEAGHFLMSEGVDFWMSE
jgi:hypothetical protein